jgi:hypothetical protein
MSFKLLDQEEERYSFVLYHPHASNSLRFFSLTPPQNPALPASSSSSKDPFRTFVKYDFTRPHPINIQRALNATLLNQASYLHPLSILFPQPNHSSMPASSFKTPSSPGRIPNFFL